MLVRRFIFGAVLGLVPFVLLAPGCGSSKPTTIYVKDGANDVALSDASRLDAPIRPDASCSVIIAAPVLLDSPHVDIGTLIQYPTNPPASGPHYPIWAAFQEFSTPVPRPFWVHSLEHGAVVLLYNCAKLGGSGPPDAGVDATTEAGDDAADGDTTDGGNPACTALVDQLRALMNSLPEDPLCDKDAGPARRVVLTPDPLIDGPVAAAAWGWTYNAACFDKATLEAFAKEHYGKGTEDFCTNGQTFF
ncbi:hypothetical protein BH09MYX1_BH09MYX1_42190 [soil metagenome]